MSKRVTRREILRGTIGAGAGVWLAGSRKVLAEAVSPNERLNVAFVGSGGQAETQEPERSIFKSERVHWLDELNETSVLRR